MKLRGPLKKFARADKKIRILIGGIAIFSVIGGVYGVVRALTPDGAAVIVTKRYDTGTGHTIFYGTRNDGFGECNSVPGRCVNATHEYVVNGASTQANKGMCIQPDKNAPAGTSSSQARNLGDSSASDPKVGTLIKVLLATNSAYDPNGVFKEFQGQGSAICGSSTDLAGCGWTQWANQNAGGTGANGLFPISGQNGINTEPAQNEAIAFGVGHVLAGKVYGDANIYHFVDAGWNQALDNMLGQINTYFNSHSDKLAGWNLYVARNNNSEQDVAWLEYEAPPASQPETAWVQIHKSDANTGEDLYDNAKFSLREGSNTGTVIQSNIGLYPDGKSDSFEVEVGKKYCFVEDTAPTGYEGNEGEYVCTPRAVTAGSTRTSPVLLEMSNVKSVGGWIRIKKNDSETGGNEQGDASVQGIKFGVFEGGCSGTRKGTITLSAGRTGRISGLTSGQSYCVKEESGGIGYVISGTSANVVAADEPVDGTSIHHTFTNDVMKGDVKITKRSKASGSNNTEPFSGVTFAILNKSENCIRYDNNTKSYCPVADGGEETALAENKVIKITTGSDGVAKTTNKALSYGSYEIREVCDSINRGYVGCEGGKKFNSSFNKMTFSITSDGQVVDLTPNGGAVINNELAPETGGIQIKKKDNETSNGQAQGEASLGGAVFAIYNNSNCSGTPLSQSLTINASTLESNVVDNLEVGTYCIKETSAGTGYKTNGTSYTLTVNAGETNKQYVNNPIPNTVKRGGVKIRKMRQVGNADGTRQPFAGVKFFIVNKSGHNVVVGDHEYNDGNAVMEIESDSDGWAATSSSVLPYGKYELRERCVQGINTLYQGCNEGQPYSYTEEFEVRNDGTIVTAKGQDNNGTVINMPDTPSITTKAQVCYQNDNKTVPISDSTCVEDQIALTNFNGDWSYRIVGKLMRADHQGSNNGLIKENSVMNFDPGSSVTLRFTNIDTSELVGKELYIVTEVYVLTSESDQNGVLLTRENENNTDVNEKVTVDARTIDTTAEGEDGSINANGDLYVGNVTVKDTIVVTGLKRNVTYQIQGYIKDGNGNKIPLLNGDTNDNTLRTENYVMSAATGSLVTPVMVFNFDSSAYVGQTLTVIEKVIDNSGGPSIEHNGGATQQVKVVTPEISTLAKNKVDGETKNPLPIGNVDVVDYVTYSGLKAGDSYTLKATIYDVDNTDSVIKTAQSSFTVSASNGSGTTGVSESPVFNFSAKDLKDLSGKTLVVFEELYHGTQKIAEHKLASDTAQRVVVSSIDIGTTAGSVSDENTRTFNVGGNTTIRDKVCIKGLANGTSYRIRGWLIRKNDETQTPIRLEASTGMTNNVVTLPYEMTAATETEVCPTVDFTFSSVEQMGKQLVVFEELLDENGTNVLAEHKEAIEKQTVTMTIPDIGTSAENGNENYDVVDRKLLYIGEVPLIDKVSYENLVPGQTYKLCGQIMRTDGTSAAPLRDKNGDYIIKDNNGNPRLCGDYVADGASGEWEMRFDLNLENLNLEEDAGADVVVFEYLYFGGTEIAKHEDKNVGPNNEQWVKIVNPEFKTTATDSDEDNIVEPEKNQVVIDNVYYSGLEPGKEYTISGTLMQKDGENTGKPLKVNGREITSTNKFTAESDGEGTVEVTFTFDATDFPGVTLVAFEKLYVGTDITGEPLKTHENIEDEEQTVFVRPRVGTEAVDKLDGNHEVGVGNVTIVDTVKYEGLTVGKRYVAVGTLVDRKTGKMLEVITRCDKDKSQEEESETPDGETSDDESHDNSENTNDEQVDDEQEKPKDCIVPEKAIKSIATFTVESDQNIMIKDGTVKLEFYLSTRDLVGKEVVVYEEVYDEDEYNNDENQKPVSEHKDLNDKSQIVLVSDPTIGTTATDKIDGDKEVNNNGTVVIEDTVQYTGLVPGTSYTLRGSLINKNTGEALTLLDSTVEANEKNGKDAALSDDNKELSLVVTPDRTNGKFYMDFEIATDGLAGQDLVVFESLYIETIKEGEEEDEYIFGEKELVQHHDLKSESQTVHVKVNPPDTGAIQKDGGSATAAKVVFIAICLTIGGSLGWYFGNRFYKKCKMRL